MHYIKFLLTFFAVWFSNINLTYAKLITPPTLAAPTHSSVVLQIEFSSMSDQASILLEHLPSNNQAVRPQIVISKPTKIEETTANPTTYVYKYLVDNLAPGEKYSYSSTLENGQKFSGNFSTAPLPNTKFRMAVMGDNRSGPKYWDKIAAGMFAHKPQLSVLLGDLAYKPDYEEWRKDFFLPNALELFANSPFVNTPGNHEKWKQNTMAFTSSPSGNLKEPYYAFDYGDITFVNINTEIDVSKNSPQWKFAEKILKESKNKWKIVIFHIPAYSFGGHKPSSRMKTMTSEVFEPLGVDIIMNGHSHFYQHNIVNKIHHFIIGGGGSPLYTPETSEYTRKSIKKYHYAIFDVESNVIEMKVYDYENKLIDEYTFKKE